MNDLLIFTTVVIATIIILLVSYASGRTAERRSCKATPIKSQDATPIPTRTPPTKPKSVAVREFTEQSQGGYYTIPRFGWLRKLWIELPTDTRWIRVTINADYYLYAEPRFLKEHIRDNVLHLEELLPMFSMFNVENYYRVEISIEPNDKPFKVHRRIEQWSVV